MEIAHTNYENKRKIVNNYSTLMGADWAKEMEDLLCTEYMDHMIHYIENIYEARPAMIFPSVKNDIWNPFKTTVFRDVTVVIVNDKPLANIFSNGMGPGEHVNSASIAKDSAFSVRLNTLKKLIVKDYHESPSEQFDFTLKDWAQQGVLLLNNSFISQLNESEGSDHSIIFRNFIREVIAKISDELYGVVFVFTSPEQSKYFKKHVDQTYHSVIETTDLVSDPKLYSRINDLVIDNFGPRAEIKW